MTNFDNVNDKFLVFNAIDNSVLPMTDEVPFLAG